MASTTDVLPDGASTTDMLPEVVSTTDDLPEVADGQSDLVLDQVFNGRYALLTEKEQQIYEQIYRAVENAQPSLELEGIDSFDYVSKITDAVWADHPQFFWWEGAVLLELTEDDYSAIMTLSFEYNDLVDNLEVNKKLFNEAAQRLLQQARQFKSLPEQELFIHDALASQVLYEHDSLYNQTAFSALVYKKSICAGISKAFQYLMTSLGVLTFYISGQAMDLDDEVPAWENHGWNIVQLDGRFYNVDVTWDILPGDFFKGQSQQVAIYTYFNRSDYSFEHSQHIRASQFDPDEPVLPAATGSEYTFENFFDSNKIASVFNKNFATGENDYILSLDDFWARAYDHLRTNPQADKTFYLLVGSRSLKEEIASFPDTKTSREMQHKLFADEYRNYTAFSVGVKNLEVAENIYLSRFNYSFER